VRGAKLVGDRPPLAKGSHGRVRQGDCVELEALEPALARLALERVDERQGDGRGGSDIDPDLGAQAVEARERPAPDDRVVATEGDDGRMVEGPGLGGSNGDGFRKCAPARMVAGQRRAAIGADPPLSCGRLRTAFIAR
jgi:hypothetical protein